MTALSDLSEGDEIRTGARESTLTVEATRDTESGKGVIVEATNGRTEYRLIQYEWDPKPVLCEGEDRVVVGGVEVERVDE